MSVMNKDRASTGTPSTDLTPSIAARMARVVLHLADAREHLARAAWINQERRRWEQANRRPRGLFIGFL